MLLAKLCLYLLQNWRHSSIHSNTTYSEVSHVIRCLLKGGYTFSRRRWSIRDPTKPDKLWPIGALDAVIVEAMARLLCYPIPVCSKPKWIANSLSLSYPWHYSPEQLMCVANTPATLSTRRLRMLELLPFMFKRPTARTRPAECEFNYEEMGKPSLLVASMKNIEKNYFRL